MFRIAKYLEINRSLDGGRSGSRWFHLPGAGGERPLQRAGQGRMSPEFISDLKSHSRGDAAAIAHRASGRMLF